MRIEKSDVAVIARNILVVIDRLGIDTLRELERINETYKIRSKRQWMIE